ncbi:MAG TPA: TlpA family protein disulfide reductase [Calditrichaeota bacterium]|nr:TlpA family protein disulfide reductase [Calditrichota bacterium]
MKRLIILLLLIPFLLLAQELGRYKLNDVDGNSFLFRKNLDHDANILVFWATWCLPCKKEFPELQKLKEKYKERDIQIIAISIDSPRSLAKVKMFTKSHTYDFVYLVDPSGDVTNKLLVKEVPHTMLVDRSGKVVYSLTGYRKGDEKQLEEAMLKLWKPSEDKE